MYKTINKYTNIHDTQQQTKPTEVQAPPDLGLAHTECGSVQTMFVGTKLNNINELYRHAVPH